MNIEKLENEERGIVSLTPIEIKDLEALKIKLFKGKESSKDLEDARCEFERYAKYLEAGIPQIYWGIDWDDFKGDEKAYKFVQLYLKHIDDAMDHGQGFIFYGQHGTGKTTLSCLIAKSVIKMGYTVKFISIAKIIDLITESFDSREKKNRLDIVIERVEFLILDDLGKEYLGVRRQLSPMVSLKLDSLIRERGNRGKVTIATTNYSKKEIKESYGDSVFSVLNGACKAIRVEGEDYRLYRSQKFWEELEKKK